MDFNYIIIQAGGKGTRLDQLTRNKPKGIVPVGNLPMVFHLFKKYPNKKYIIICDYLASVMEKYLAAFAEVDYTCVIADGKGTCGGISKALECIPNGVPLMITWSDLVFDDKFDESVVRGNTIGVPVDFQCRWSLENGRFIEKPSVNNGVAGVFFFENKELLRNVPSEGEFVRFLSETGISFSTVPLIGVKEVGTLLAYQKEGSKFVCRPFNSIVVENGHVIKRPISKQGVALAEKETNWYRYVSKFDFPFLPIIYKTNPLDMELVNGNNLFLLTMSKEEKKKAVENIINSLETLHGIKQPKNDPSSIFDVYFTKTFKRLGLVQDLVPFAYQKTIIINGKEYKNPFFLKEKIKSIIDTYFLDDKFTLIHGDPTLSNVLVKSDFSVVLIDPRGYFGRTDFCGDPYYDWAKLYYSIVGNYDQFNRKHFLLSINDNNAEISVESNGCEFLEQWFFDSVKQFSPRKIKFLHSLIWLSLTTYSWEDYDSICGSFYIGTKLLNEAIGLFEGNK